MYGKQMVSDFPFIRKIAINWAWTIRRCQQKDQLLGTQVNWALKQLGAMKIEKFQSLNKDSHLCSTR